MPYRFIALLGYFLASSLSFAQLPILRTTKAKLSIREGRSFYEGVWDVSSAAKPDVFVSQPVKDTHRIVFYSDLDSLAFVVAPQHVYNFVVLNGRDSAYTRISTFTDQRPSLAPKLIYSRLLGHDSGPDTIPFRLDRTAGIHLQGQLNGSPPLDLFFDTGAGAMVVTKAAVQQKVQLVQDKQVSNTGTDGKHTVLLSSSNRLQLGNLTWSDVSLLTIDYGAINDTDVDFDGIVGWLAFEGKVVAVDYDQRHLIVYDQLPPLGADYSPVEMKFTNGIPFIKCGLTVDGTYQEGWFDLDTGSDGWLVVGQQFANSNDLTRTLRQQGTAYATGSGGGRVARAVYSLPTLTLGAYQLYQLPLYVNKQDPVGGAIPENIGSQILKRFNLILDFKGQKLYVKPNRNLYSPLKAAKP
jgi:predicted aspartyl protease